MVVLTCFPPPSDGIHCKQQNTKAYIEQKFLGDGTLYIAEDRLSWVSTAGEGFSLEYPAISLHAVSRDLSSFHAECLYLMIDHDITDMDEHNDSGSEHSESEAMSVVRFVPDDKGTLDVMFGAMNDCQALHPDELDDDNDEYYGGDGDTNNVHLSNQGQRTLDHLENIFNSSGDVSHRDNESNVTDQLDEDGEPMEEQFEDAD